jgi:DNA-binding XRE family transcriptional regulator
VGTWVVRRLLGNDSDPSLPLAFKIARVFGMRIEELFQDEAAEG